MGKCADFQKRHVSIYLKFQHGGYIPIENDEKLEMAVEMVFRYHVASLDPRELPTWMDDMDIAWENEDLCDQYEGDESDSQSDDSDMYYDGV